MKVHETWQEESQVLWQRVTSDKVVACSCMHESTYRRCGLQEAKSLGAFPIISNKFLC
jgi:hypothetical protein